MAKIEVNHQTLRDVSKSISDFCELMDKQMNSAKTSVEDMMRDYTGDDAIAFKEKWDAALAPESSYTQFKNNLQVYASILSTAAETYRKAQEDVYNEANRLPKFFYW